MSASPQRSSPHTSVIEHEISSVWQPDTLPPHGQVRSDGQSYAIYLPLSPRDLAPWRVISKDHRLMPAITHAVAYGPSWTVFPTMVEIITSFVAGAQPATSQSAPDLLSETRVFFPGDPCPADVSAVMTPDGQVWPATEWKLGGWMDWDQLLADYKGAVEVPVRQLLEVAGILQSRRTAAS